MFKTNSVISIYLFQALSVDTPYVWINQLTAKIDPLYVVTSNFYLLQCNLLISYWNPIGSSYITMHLNSKLHLTLNQIWNRCGFS